MSTLGKMMSAYNGKINFLRSVNYPLSHQVIKTSNRVVNVFMNPKKMSELPIEIRTSESQLKLKVVGYLLADQAEYPKRHVTDICINKKFIDGLEKSGYHEVLDSNVKTIAGSAVKNLSEASIALFRDIAVNNIIHNEFGVDVQTEFYLVNNEQLLLRRINTMATNIQTLTGCWRKDKQWLHISSAPYVLYIFTNFLYQDERTRNLILEYLEPNVADEIDKLSFTLGLNISAQKLLSRDYLKENLDTRGYGLKINKAVKYYGNNDLFSVTLPNSETYEKWAASRAFGILDKVSERPISFDRDDFECMMEALELFLSCERLDVSTQMNETLHILLKMASKSFELFGDRFDRSDVLLQLIGYAHGLDHNLSKAFLSHMLEKHYEENSELNF